MFQHDLVAFSRNFNCIVIFALLNNHWIVSRLASDSGDRGLYTNTLNHRRALLRGEGIGGCGESMGSWFQQYDPAFVVVV